MRGLAVQEMFADYKQKDHSFLSTRGRYAATYIIESSPPAGKQTSRRVRWTLTDCWRQSWSQASFPSDITASLTSGSSLDVVHLRVLWERGLFLYSCSHYSCGQCHHHPETYSDVGVEINARYTTTAHVRSWTALTGMIMSPFKTDDGPHLSAYCLFFFSANVVLYTNFWKCD